MYKIFIFADWNKKFKVKIYTNFASFEKFYRKFLSKKIRNVKDYFVGGGEGGGLNLFILKL